VGLLDDKELIKQSIERALAKSYRERKRIEGFINAIEDAETRDIFRLRHINLMGWVKIGAELNMDRRTASRKHRAFLKLPTMPIKK
jgi:tRNA G26 N,N-dimethylase Trm1